MTGGFPVPYAVVVPTVGRPSLEVLLASLAAADGPPPEQVVVVDDRPRGAPDLHPVAPGRVGEVLVVRRSGARGPAAARNTGARACRTRWIAFLDDDVEVSPTWAADLQRDLAAAEAEPDVVGTQARITVPLPADRRPTDWERGTAGLADAQWITADMAFRADALAVVGGFDERFPRAFREDADVALRLVARGGRIVTGTRRTTHPVRPATWSASLKQQRGNADDALMRKLHGADWYTRANAAVGRRPVHLATTAAGVAALGAIAARRPRAALAAATVWAGLTADFARLRIAPGPRDAREVGRMLVTSVAIPPAAVWHWLAGTVRHRHAAPWPAPAGPRADSTDGPDAGVAALLVDRDGTVVEDVPYNGDPALVRLRPGVAEALDRARAAGLRVALVSNQSGIARGLLTREQVDAVNARVAELAGPFASVRYCPHGEDDGCSCRKPAPGLLTAAAADLGVPVGRCVMIGDIGSDVAAGEAAGAARSILVPTPATRPDEVAAAATVVADLGAAVDVVLGVRTPDGVAA